jgi:hypothetical protein
MIVHLHLHLHLYFAISSVLCAVEMRQFPPAGAVGGAVFGSGEYWDE